MRFLLILSLLLVGCNKKDCEIVDRKISLAGCRDLAERLNASFAYTPDRQEKCTITVDGYDFYVHTEGYADGMVYGMAMAVNRPKIKEYRKCFKDKEDSTPNMSFEQRVQTHEDCKKKHEMVNWY